MTKIHEFKKDMNVKNITQIIDKSNGKFRRDVKCVSWISVADKRDSQ